MHDVMNEWLDYSEHALDRLRAELHERERAVEAALATMRMHSQAMEQIERAIAIIENVLARFEPAPTAPPSRAHVPPPVPAASSHRYRAHTLGSVAERQQAASATHSASRGEGAGLQMNRPEAPPLRPIPTPPIRRVS